MRDANPLLLGLAAGVLALTAAGCGSLHVYGAVTDSVTAQPIGACKIAFGRYQTIATGSYNIHVPGSARTLEFKAPGYLPKSATFQHRIHSSRHIEMNVTMDRDPAATPAGMRFDPYTGKPLIPRFDANTGEPLRP